MTIANLADIPRPPLSSDRSNLAEGSQAESHEAPEDGSQSLPLPLGIPRGFPTGAAMARMMSDGLLMHNRDSLFAVGEITASCVRHVVLSTPYYPPKAPSSEGDGEVHTKQLDHSFKDNMSRYITSHTGRSRRTISLCYRDLDTWPPFGSPDEVDDIPWSALAQDLTLIAIIGVQEKLRPGVREAVAVAGHATDDAAALREAHVGFAMRSQATARAKHAFGYRHHGRRLSFYCQGRDVGALAGRCPSKPESAPDTRALMG
jgi:magnesium-transporting ATPase (P-type)